MNFDEVARFHRVELRDVVQLELEGLLAREAEREQHKAVAGHVEGAVRLPVLGMDVGGLLKIQETPIRHVSAQLVDVSQHIVMPLPEILRHVHGVRHNAPIGSARLGRVKAQNKGGPGWCLDRSVITESFWRTCNLKYSFTEMLICHENLRL